MNFINDDIPEYDKMANALPSQGPMKYILKLEFDPKKSKIEPASEKPLVLEPRALPFHLHYVLPGPDNTLPIIIPTNLNDDM